jgi:predicted small lipoprotein YifL
MKRFILVLALVAAVLSLTGCYSKKGHTYTTPTSTTPGGTSTTTSTGY